MNKCHQNINWVNDTTPAINDTNLNYMDGCIDTIDDRVVAMDTSKANQSDLLLAFKDVSLNTTTGVITFTLFDNTTKTIDTLLEKVAINFDYDDDPTSPHYQNLIIALEDGTYKYIDMSALITEYEFVNSSTVALTVAADGSVSASVIDGSITATKCDPTFALAITNAESNGLKSEGYANGTQNGTPVTSGSPYYENNAKYWKEQAQAIASQSLSGLTDVSIQSPQGGQTLIYDAGNSEWVNGSGSINAEREITPASKAHAVGDYIHFLDAIYEVTSAISLGDNIVVGTNVSLATLSEGTIIYTIGSGKFKRFDECTDAEIAAYVAAADAGMIDLATDCGWAVGQERQVSLSAINSSGTYDGVSWNVGESQSAQTATLVLMHKGLYELNTPVLNKDGTTRNTCSFVIGLKNCMETKGYINSTDTNTGSWNASARRNWCNGGFRESLPADIRPAFKEFKCVTGVYNGSQSGGTNITSIDYFALPAEKEVHGSSTYSTTNEANAVTQFTWYQATSNTLKKQGESGSASGYWNRSPHYSNSGYFACVHSSGSFNQNPATNPYGLSPFGCI